jgi:glycosyltransferase involved in cell wall biosynthesis/acetyltransferase-like isoleucine patch superfamily enzyme
MSATPGRPAVLYLVDCLYADAGGGSEKQFLKLYESHAELGIEPHVVFLVDAPVYRRLPWRSAPLVLDLPRLRSPRLAVALRQLLAHLRTHDVRVVHTIFDGAAILGALLKLLRPDLRVIMTLRNMGYHHSLAMRVFMGRIYNRADRVVVNAQAIRERLNSHYLVDPRRVEVICNMVDADVPGENRPTFPETLDPGFAELRQRCRYVAVVVANLRDIKGISDLIAAAAVLKERAELGIAVIGEGEQRAQYEAQIAAGSLERTVLLLGYKRDVRSYLAQADLAILPSRSEGLSNALIEYALAGLPIIATDVGGNREVLDGGNAGVLVPPQQPAVLAGAVDRILNDDQLRRALSAKIAEFSRHRYEPPAVLARYRQVYESLLAAPSYTRPDWVELIKQVAVLGLGVLTLPFALLGTLFYRRFGSDVFFSEFGKLLSIIPGRLGAYLRAAYYLQTLEHSHYSLRIGFGSFFAHPTTHVGRQVVVGSYSIIGTATIEDHVMIASRVSLLSGKYQHFVGAAERDNRPVDQRYQRVRIGHDSWLGEGAIVMADVGARCIVAAGAVVARPMPGGTMAIGNPARVVPRKEFDAPSARDG